MNPKYERGMVLYNNNRFEMAEKEFKEALASDTQSPMIHRMIALSIYSQNKRYDEALLAANEALRLNPQDAHSHYVASIILHKQKKYRDSEKAIDEAKKLLPLSSTYHIHDAVLAYEQNFNTEARQKIEHALSLDPSNERSIRILALVQMQAGDLNGAADTAELALRVAPDNAYAHALKAHLLFKKKKTSEAISCFRESLRINPNLEWARDGYMKALNSRNPLYGFILGIVYYAGRPPSIIFGHPYVMGASVVMSVFLIITGGLLKPVSQPILTMYMSFDHVAVQALSPNEIKDSRLLAVWIGTSMLAMTILLLLGLGWHPIFLPFSVFLYGMPMLFTRLWELRDDYISYSTYKKYFIGSTAAGFLAIICSFAPDTMTTPNLPPNFQDLSGVLVIAFFFLSLGARSFPKPREVPAEE